MLRKIWLWHLIGWFTLLSGAFFANLQYYLDDYAWINYSLGVVAYFSVKAIPFYLMYWLSARYFQNRNFPMVTAVVILSLAVGTFAQVYNWWLMQVADYPEMAATWPSRVWYFALNVLLFIAGGRIVRYAELSIVSARRRKELEQARLKAELQLMVARVNPHFLFNTLNNLYALARKQSDLTADGILKLSHIMRYMLDQSEREWVPLSEEVTFMQDFVDLQHLRLEDQFQLEAIWPPLLPSTLLVPPLIFIPVVENIFKHADLSPNSFLRIELKVDAQKIELSTLNRMSEKQPEENSFGLSNLKKRLDLLNIPHELIVKTEDGNFAVFLSISPCSSEDTLIETSIQTR